jgi:hypothetical protein
MHGKCAGYVKHLAKIKDSKYQRSHYHYHLSRETSTARHRPHPKFSTTIGLADSRDIHQIVDPPCGGPTNAEYPGTRSPIEDLSAPAAALLLFAMCPVHCHLRSAIRRAMSDMYIYLTESEAIRSVKEPRSTE